MWGFDNPGRFAKRLRYMWIRGKKGSTDLPLPYLAEYIRFCSIRFTGAYDIDHGRRICEGLGIRDYVVERR